MKILFLESFYGGSHKDFADGYIKHSRHSIDIVTMPARFWKWRMRGASLYMLNQIQNPGEYDLIFTTDLLNVSDLKALWRTKCPPVVLYYHENQLVYPLPEGKKMDLQFGFTDIINSLAADGILFNSNMHRDLFLDAIRPFLKKMPDFQPKWVEEEIRRKTNTLYPGCQFPPITKEENFQTDSLKIPIILWNHRWEFDKNPKTFFWALEQLKERGTSFKLVILGESFQVKPKDFNRAKEVFKEEIIHLGFVPTKKDYYNWLRKSHIVISTSIQENFGISVVEAMRYGCHPLLPNRLSYPEILHKDFHADCLYDDGKELVEKLYTLIEERKYIDPKKLAEAMSNHSWPLRVDEYDNYCENILDGQKKET